MNRAWRRVLPPVPAPSEGEPEGDTDPAVVADLMDAMPDTPEGRQVVADLKAGFPHDRNEVLSYFADAAPPWFTPNPDAADRMKARLAIQAEAKDYDPTKALPPDLVEQALQVERFRARWEEVIATTLRRFWDRKKAMVLAKSRSVQFRRNTPLWDPPGTVPLTDRTDVLVDVEAWDAELVEEIRPILRDLQIEAVTFLGLGMVEEKANTFADFLATWLRHVLRFNRAAYAAVQKILAAEPTRVVDIEDEVNDFVDRTMRVSGGQVANSLSTGAVNEAQNDAAEAVGATEKIWFSAQDGRVRATHRHLNGQRVPVGAPFKARDRKGRRHEMRHPGDITAPMDLWINCRCVMLFVTPISGNVWMRPDGSPIDPYRRANFTIVPEEKSLPAHVFDNAWGE